MGSAAKLTLKPEPLPVRSIAVSTGRQNPPAGLASARRARDFGLEMVNFCL
jgi:hypothetical protein